MGGLTEHIGQSRAGWHVILRSMKILLLVLAFSLGCSSGPVVWEESTFQVEEEVEDFSICALEGSSIALVERRGNDRTIWRSFSGCVPGSGFALPRPVLVPGLTYALSSECLDCVWVVFGFEPVFVKGDQ